MQKFKLILSILLLLITLSNVALFIRDNENLYTEKFNPQLYRNLWGQSQYVTITPTQMLPDEIVYSFAAWEYMHGVNPAVFNADQPPLGKYFIGVSELWFGNPRIPGPVFNILTLIALFFLANLILKNYLWSAALVTLFSFEKIFIVQMKYAPLLDNIHLFFILLSFIFFIFSRKNSKVLILAFLMLGAVASTKFWATAAIIYVIWLVYILILKAKKQLLNFIKFSPSIFATMLVVYMPAFLQGTTLREFFGVQKYIYSFHHDKLNIDPFAVWDLLILNRWHSFSGIRYSVDWQITWPVFTILSLLAVILIFRKQLTNQTIVLFAVWVIIYFTLLSFSSILPRYLIPVIPAMYILSFWILKLISVNLIKSKK